MPPSLRAKALSRFAFSFLIACGAPEEDGRALPGTVEELAAGYVRLAFALSEHDPLFLDLVFSAPAPAETPLSLREIAERADRLAGGVVARSADPVRLRRIEASLTALAFRARAVAGEHRPAAAELREVFGLDWTEPDLALDRLHSRVGRALPGVGPLRVRARRHVERSGLPPAAVESRLLAALAGCRDRSLPPNVRLGIGPVRLHWITPAEATGLPTGPAPFYRYEGDGVGVFSLPRGFGVRSSELARLACHEGVPGHHLQAVVAAAQFRATGWPELGIVPLYGPRTAVFEGLAGILERLAPTPPADAALRALEPVVSSVLRRYLDGELGRLEAVRALDFEGFVPDPHGLLDHADRFRGYALVAPSADPVFFAALERLLAPDLGREERFSRIVRVIEEAMDPREAVAILSPSE